MCVCVCMCDYDVIYRNRTFTYNDARNVKKIYYYLFQYIK